MNDTVKQIDQLAAYLSEHYLDEISVNEGAASLAMRLLDEARAYKEYVAQWEKLSGHVVALKMATKSS